MLSSKIQNRARQCFGMNYIDQMHFSAFFCIYLHFSTFLCISLYLSKQIWHSCVSWRSLHICEFLYISFTFLCIFFSHLSVSLHLNISLHFSTFFCINMHFTTFLWMSLHFFVIVIYVIPPICTFYWKFVLYESTKAA